MITAVNRPEAAWLPLIYKEIGGMKARAQVSGTWFKVSVAVFLVVFLLAFANMFWYAASHGLIDI